MSRNNVLGSLALAASLAISAGGCVVRGQATVAEPVAVVEVDSEPPPPQYEEVVVRPGFIWIQGRWNWQGGRWVWMGGHYERERAGYVWAPGRWEARGNRHVWVEGQWRAGASPAVRDHREGPPPPATGPVVRDHRHP
jgi:YXWGXW repeat-containing protein